MNGDDQTVSKDKITQPAQESTRDLIKLLISLSSGVIALSATFVEKVSIDVRFIILVLYASWIGLAISIYFGIKSLSMLVHAQQNDAANWYNFTLPPMQKCWVSFQIGVAILIVYASIVSGIKAFNPKTEEDKQVIVRLDSASRVLSCRIDSTHNPFIHISPTCSCLSQYQCLHRHKEKLGQ